MLGHAAGKRRRKRSSGKEPSHALHLPCPAPQPTRSAPIACSAALTSSSSSGINDPTDSHSSCAGEKRGEEGAATHG